MINQTLDIILRSSVKVQNMFKTLRRFCVLQTLCLLGFAPNLPASNPWHKVNDLPDVQIYTRQEPGTPVVTVKGEGTLDFPIEEVKGVLLNIPRTLEWVERLREAKILKTIDSQTFITYAHFSSGFFFVKDRDFVNLNSFKFLPETKGYLFESHSVEESSMPVKEDYIRGKVNGSSMLITPVEGNKTRFIVVLNSDPMGSVPKWIVNILVKRIPLRTFQGLKEQLQRVKQERASKANQEK